MPKCVNQLTNWVVADTLQFLSLLRKKWWGSSPGSINGVWVHVSSFFLFLSSFIASAQIDRGYPIAATWVGHWSFVLCVVPPQKKVLSTGSLEKMET
jgi:hypothetical protein